MQPSLFLLMAKHRDVLGHLQAQWWSGVGPIHIWDWHLKCYISMSVDTYTYKYLYFSAQIPWQKLLPWLSVRLQYLQCISIGYTAVLHLAIDITYAYQYRHWPNSPPRTLTKVLIPLDSRLLTFTQESHKHIPYCHTQITLLYTTYINRP